MKDQLEKEVLKVRVVNTNSMLDINWPSHSIAEQLRERGYDIAGHAGIRNKKPTTNFIGILKDRKPIEKKILGFKYVKKQRALHLGTLWFNNKSKNAHENTNWVLEIYGRKYVPQLTKLANSFSDQYNVRLDIKLKSEYPIEESYLSDLL